MGAFSKIQFDSLRWISWWTDPNLGDICTAAAQNRKRGRGIFVTVFDLMKYFAGADFGERGRFTLGKRVGGGFTSIGGIPP